jgi:hypothetical protein
VLPTRGTCGHIPRYSILQQMTPVQYAGGKKTNDPADATVWAVPVKAVSASKTATPTNTTDLQSSTPICNMSSALSDTIDNILGLISKQADSPTSKKMLQTWEPPPQLVLHASSESLSKPPSAACINKALRAVLVAAEQTAVEQEHTGRKRLSRQTSLSAASAALHAPTPTHSVSSSCHPSHGHEEAGKLAQEGRTRRLRCSDVSDLTGTLEMVAAQTDVIARRSSISNGLYPESCSPAMTKRLHLHAWL